MRSHKKNFRAGVTLLLFSAVFSATLCLGFSLARELPLLVELSDLGDMHDGMRITIFGWVQSGEVKTGRRGSLYLDLIVGVGEDRVTVVMTKPASNILNRRVIVQGIYHKEGSFGGHQKEHFIDAETIVRDWGDEK
ncbi:MAG: hypothetical protein ABGX83_06410 [Nitrospira sp.]|nr:hypothetical protein [Candidatus Manganitrophaceae bacterium]HIL34417.1 hypothetical protein [Candidatus Manganitrophaceae bacterium]